MSVSEAITEGIRVRVDARFSPAHSDRKQRLWFFLYTIRIANESERTVQLLNRRWVITDATGHIEQVHGAGVVGRQPTLRRGESFEYTSGCPLRTPFGSMHGAYEMASESGERLLVQIPPFALRESEAFQ